MKKGNKALVIFSGGQDSTTCLYWAKKHFSEVSAITFSYGQKHIIELDSAITIAKMASVPHEIISLGELWKGLSSLTDPSQSIPSAKGEESGLPSTFVPGRNILFLTIAGARAYSYNCDSIVIGVSQEDYAGYPDCRKPFITSMEDAIGKGLDRKISIEHPLMNLDKKETVELAQELPGCMEALAYSTTCYNGAQPPCMDCNACKLRANGFSQADCADPLVERFESGASLC